MIDFRGLINLLEERGELIRIGRPVDPRYEMPALMAQVDARRRAFLFERVKGSRFPVVGGLLNRLETFGWVLGERPGEPFSERQLAARFEAARAAGVAPRQMRAEGSSAPVKDVILTGAAVDLRILPAPTAFELDSGPFLTGAVGLVRMPDGGQLNMGIYRTLICGHATLAVNAGRLSDLNQACLQAGRAGTRLPIALALGVDPAVLMAAAYKLEPNRCELELAGALRGAPVDLVRCETNDLLVPASAEIVIEGSIDVSRRVDNVLGEFAGQYGPNTAPIVEVTAITHRRDALFYAILAGMNPEHNTVGSLGTLSMKRDVEAELRRSHPQIRQLCVHFLPRIGTLAHVAASIEKRSEDEPMALCEAILGSTAAGLPVSRITKRVVIVDDDVDVDDIEAVEWAIWTRSAGAGKWKVIPDVPSWHLERSAKPTGSVRIAVDATADFEDRDKVRRTVIPGAAAIRLSDFDAHTREPVGRDTG